MNDPSKFTKMGIKPPKGAFRFMDHQVVERQFLGRALATESGANMILVRGPEILIKMGWRIRKSN